MGDNEERKQIIEYIKEHYDKFRKTPSMKDIQLGCKINPRVFYNLFKNQKEAFNLAHVPYSDLTRKKVEKANIARKRETGDVLRKGPLRTFYVVVNKPTAVKEDNNYLKKTKLMMDELNNSYINYLQSNRSDKESIKEAYNNLSYVIPIWYTSLIGIDKNYLLAKSPNIDSLFKVYLAEEGFDFADIEGSYKKMCENKFNEIIEEESPKFDMKAKMYYYKILREVFGSPPDLTSV